VDRFPVVPKQNTGTSEQEKLIQTVAMTKNVKTDKKCQLDRAMHCFEQSRHEDELKIPFFRSSLRPVLALLSDGQRQ